MEKNNHNENNLPSKQLSTPAVDLLAPEDRFVAASRLSSQWSQEIHVPQTIEGAFAQGAEEMIVVLPDSKTVHNGSMYSSSVTTGDWEGFLTDDLVSYVDSHYRTLADRMSRGLAGHSMGGYGTLRLGMKHPEVFSSLYAMSSCCLIPNLNPNPEQFAALQREVN